jgi:hypothetical protein
MITRTGYITPSRFKDVMTPAKGWKSKIEIETDVQNLQMWVDTYEHSRVTKTFLALQDKLTKARKDLKHFDPASRFGETAKSYAVEVALGRFGIEMPSVNAASVQHGNRYESEARARYEQETGNAFPSENFRAVSVEFPFIAGQSDGNIYRADGRKWGGEIKCPWNPVNHYRNLVSNAQFVEDYKWQTSGYCGLYGWEGFTAISYNPNFPHNAQLSYTDFERDEALIKELFDTLVAFEHDIVRPLVKQIEDQFKTKSFEI